MGLNVLNFVPMPATSQKGNEVSAHHVSGVKHQLEAKQVQVDSLSSRVRHLEATLSNRV